MLEHEPSHEENIFDNNLNFLNKLTDVAELLGLLVLLLPLIFLSKNYYVFAVLILLIIFIVHYVTQRTSVSKDKFPVKLPTIICLGLVAGIIQLDPTPLLCVIFLAIVSVVVLKLAEKLIFLVLFFTTATFSYFVCSLVLNVTLIVNNTYINFASIVALFFTLTLHSFALQYRYFKMRGLFVNSRDRFQHFMKLSNNLARYVPEQVWKRVIHENKDVLVENKRRKLTVFFSDIKGFTDMSEAMSAEDLTFFLNEYFGSMSSIAKKHGATIDKFVGDALMVFFGDPDTNGEREDALACVEMAVDMNRELARLRNYWIALGFDGIHVRMGVNTGYCHVGNFGSQDRVSYTAIGKEVNLAARIQDKANANSVFISETTHELIKHRFLCQKGDKVMLKGIAEPVQLWEVRRHRQGDEIKEAQWLEHDLPGFNLHLNMLNMEKLDKESIKTMLIKAGRIVDQSIKNDRNQL